MPISQEPETPSPNTSPAPDNKGNTRRSSRIAKRANPKEPGSNLKRQLTQDGEGSDADNPQSKRRKTDVASVERSQPALDDVAEPTQDSAKPVSKRRKTGSKLDGKRRDDAGNGEEADDGQDGLEDQGRRKRTVPVKALWGS